MATRPLESSTHGGAARMAARRRVSAQLLVVMTVIMVVAASCSSGEQASSSTTPAAETQRPSVPTTISSPNSTPGSGTVTDRGPRPADLADIPAYAILATGELIALDVWTGAHETVLETPSEGAAERTSVAAGPDGEVVYAERTGPCDSQIVHLSDDPMFDPLPGAAPTFSRDGQTMAYLAHREGDPVAEDGRCFYVTIVVRDIGSGDERTWTFGPEGEDPLFFYDYAGTPVSLELAHDSSRLAFDVIGEASWTSTIDLTAEAATIDRLQVAPDIDAELQGLLTDAYGLAAQYFDADSLLHTLAWEWGGGSADTVAEDDTVTTIVSSSADPTTLVGIAERDGYVLGRNSLDGSGRVALTEPDGTETELLAEAASIDW